MTEQNNLFDVPEEEGVTLGLYAEKAYLDYAVSVVKGRALPDVSDGQKPVQRRILYAMNAMGLKNHAKPVKSARVVGDVLGKYHPHGDQAAYDAMVRMAQSFTLRYPLVDGQGNFGSRDGDGAAAMRYTEARLTPMAELLLEELGEGTVDFIPNYDGSEKEPVLLPARLPMMLLNGASGIAVGMATEIPSHNLREIAAACVALLKKPNMVIEELLSFVPGPDFANGAQIITAAEEIAEIYKSGRGSIKVRARWEFEELARGQWQLVVTELPPNTSAQKILEEIEEISNPRVRTGRKALTSEQQQARSAMLSLLDSVRDESGKDAAVRLVFEPKTSKVSREDFVNQLLAKTSMEGNASINLVCIGIDGRPRQRNLLEILTEWLQFRTTTVTRRTQYRLDKVSDRIHVLEGRMVVYLNVDEVIATIRESDEPRPALMNRFNLSERQAEDILEMRLRQLARLEGFKIEQELEEKRKEQAELQHLLANPAAMRKMMIKEIEADAKKYGDERRTIIQEAEKAVLEIKVADEPVTVVISQKGWIRSRQHHGHDPQQFNFKAGDKLYDTFEVRTVDQLIALSNVGRAYTVEVADLPSARGDGQPITAMVDSESNTKINHFIAADKAQQLLLVQEHGVGFITTIEDMVSRQKAGKQFVTLETPLLKPLFVKPDDRYLALLSKKGRFLIIALSEVKKLAGGGLGTILIGLDDDDKLSQVVAFGENGLAVSGTYRRKASTDVLSLNELEVYIAKRARKGRALDVRLKDISLSRAPEGGTNEASE
ncbi:DNA topoisomerase IV subunit A [Oligella urethralis]|uniref:DNA topoisomerase IV subunit A n=1 Tax=Oligella urethralis TaxID=90245 RepID=UPI000C9B69E6|nr:DNA topoisomerase IV subunit A [Oligella urethralis]PMC15402.1 DNA topoisomerase IV subunit A [Oligella urethralis]